VRLFVAVGLPEEARTAIVAATTPARALLPKARWVKRENLHLTLAFLGQVSVEQRDRAVRFLREKLEQGEGFRYFVREVGAFPPAGRVRVVWLGLEPPAPFEALAATVRSALREADVPFDDKPFRAHVTIARCDPAWAPPLRATIAERLSPLCAPLSKPAIGCDRVTLFASTLGSAGPSYVAEAEFRLRPGASLPAEAAGAA
jgi:2'-5' RNA ligase